MAILSFDCPKRKNNQRVDAKNYSQRLDVLRRNVALGVKPRADRRLTDLDLRGHIGLLYSSVQQSMFKAFHARE